MPDLSQWKAAGWLAGSPPPTSTFGTPSFRPNPRTCSCSHLSFPRLLSFDPEHT